MKEESLDIDNEAVGNLLDACKLCYVQAELMKPIISNMANCKRSFVLQPLLASLVTNIKGVISL